MNILYANWVDRSKKTLGMIKETRSKQDLDRLDMIKNIRFALMALAQSIAGWMQWMNNPEIMTSFSREELIEMGDILMDIIEKFIEYDIETTNEGLKKGVEKQRESQNGIHFIV